MNTLYHTSNDASVALLARAMRAAQPPPIPAEDWDILFSAVRTRLHLSADASAERVQGIVLECLQALEQLHVMLAAERRQARPLSLQGLVIERLVRPLMPGDRDAAARKFTAACSPAEPRSLP